MPKSNSLIDNDFIDEQDVSDDPFMDPHEKERAEFEGRELKPDKSKPNEDNTVDVEIVDDTPEKDRGKWVADDERDGEPDVPDEDEVKDYSEAVQKRISKLTARMHAERRAREERDREFTEALNTARRLLNENNHLKEIVEGGEKVLIGEHKGRLEGQLQSARAAYREASEAGDTNGVLAAQEEIAKIVSQMDRLSTHRPQTLQREEIPWLREQQQQQPPQQVAKPPSDRALQWRERNPWFENDIPMKAYALGLHKQLFDNGVQVDSPEYYQRIDREMRSRFPDRFRNETRRQDTVVAPAGRAGRPQGSRRVRLTENQVRIAKRLGLTPEQMAKQILDEQENGSGHEFTHTPRT